MNWINVKGIRPQYLKVKHTCHVRLYHKERDVFTHREKRFQLWEMRTHQWLTHVTSLTPFFAVKQHRLAWIINLNALCAVYWYHIIWHLSTEIQFSKYIPVYYLKPCQEDQFDTTGTVKSQPHSSHCSTSINCLITQQRYLLVDLEFCGPLEHAKAHTPLSQVPGRWMRKKATDNSVKGKQFMCWFALTGGSDSTRDERSGRNLGVSWRESIHNLF